MRAGSCSHSTGAVDVDALAAGIGSREHLGAGGQRLPVRESRAVLLDVGRIPPLLPGHRVVGAGIEDAALVERRVEGRRERALPDLQLDGGVADAHRLVHGLAVPSTCIRRCSRSSRTTGRPRGTSRSGSTSCGSGSRWARRSRNRRTRCRPCPVRRPGRQPPLVSTTVSCEISSLVSTCRSRHRTISQGHFMLPDPADHRRPSSCGSVKCPWFRDSRMRDSRTLSGYELFVNGGRIAGEAIASIC